MIHEEYDDEVYFEICDQMEAQIEKAITKPGRTQKERFVNALKESYTHIVTYSAYETDDVGMPINNLDEVPYKGTFTIAYDGGWGDNRYESDPITDPTWLELAVFANTAIHVSGDDHHIFLECADKKGNKLHLGFGS